MDNEDLIRDFLKDIELRGWSKWTVKSCKYSLNLFNESIKGKLFRDVNKEELKDFLIFLKKRQGRNGKVSLETLRKHINNLSSFFEYLEDEEVISKSPVVKFRRTYVRNSFKDAHQGQTRQIIDLSEMRKLIGSILEPHDKAMFVLLVVASGSVGTSLDLNKISKALNDAVFDPIKFPGLVYKLKKPKTALLLFSSGKFVCTGAKSVEMIHDAVGIVMANLKKLGIKVSKDPQIMIQNIVATADLKRELNLNTIAISLGLERVEYEPEQFPGLVYRVEKPKVVMLLFGSGKIVCTGAKEVKDIEIALQEVVRELTDTGLL